ncbi:MAG: porin [Agarilytica sp.]
MTGCALVLTGAICAVPSMAVDLGEYGGTSVALKGYVKFDAMMSQYDSGALPANAWYRDFYVPSLTPVGDDDSSENTVVDMHARQSRFALATKSDVDGTALKTYIEMDFMLTSNSNERVSNSYSPRLRHAFLTYGNWTYGQTWSTFMNVGALPETLDFIGNTDASIFVRQSMVRYTNGGFQFALENPETTITPYGGGGRIVTDDNSVPDVVVRYNYSSDSFKFTVAGLARQLEYNDAGSDIDESTSGFGLSLSGSVMLGKDDLKFVLNTGSGMGRYIGLNIANDAVINADGELEAIDSTGASLSYRHWWNDQWRSTVVYSAISVDNDEELTGTAVSKTSSSQRINLLYSPTKRLTLGGELAFASREIESGDDGSMTRLQFSAKLAF